MHWPARCEWDRNSAATRFMLVNLSGRGDKDMTTAAKWFNYFDEGAVQV